MGGTERVPRGVALVMVLLVLSVLALVAGPFAVSMALHDRQSRRSEGEEKARWGAEAGRNHAIALLSKTHTARESDLEAVELEKLRPPDPDRRAQYQPAPQATYGRSQASSSSGSGRTRRHGVHAVKRADLGDDSPARRQNGPMGRRALDARNRQATGTDLPAPTNLLVSEKGPPPKSYDPPEDLKAELPAKVALDDPDDPDAVIGFDQNGLSTSVTVEDEQAKINVNTAPPNLMANLLGVSRLARPLEAGAVSLLLEDGSVFRTDADPRTIDGAVVVVHSENGRVEAITYRSRRENELQDCFRGAFLSVPYDKEFPEGSFVYDLRGYKIGHHQLRAQAEGGFAPSRLAEFATIEGIREIASWQIASLFLIRFRGEGLTAEFLEKNGINTKKLEELGLDPAIFAVEDPRKDKGLKAELEAAVKSLRKLHVQGAVIEGLKKARGARGVIGFEARVANLKPAEAQKSAVEMQKALERDRRAAPQFSRKYLEEALANLGEVYRTPGMETLLPEELDRLRDSITVSSQVPARWSEAQSNPDPLPAGPTWNESFRSARPGELGGGALVRLRPRKAPGEVEFNRLVHRGKTVPVGGYQLAYPLLRSYPAGEAWIDALERHPVNVNTASERVLRAVFTGVAGFKQTKDGDHTVSPAEAARLAALVVQKLPLKSHADFQQLLYQAADAEAIDSEDIEPLLLNAIHPNDPRLKISTTGFCYATGDVYTIDSLSVLRSEAGSQVAAAHLREIVEISAPEPLRLGLFSQADYQSELFLRDPFTAQAPEDHAFHSVSFPGIRGHLVVSSPLLLRSPLGSFKPRNQKTGFAEWPLAGGEVGTLRLITGESTQNRSTHGEILHFRNTFEGRELAPGEPFVLDISSDGKSSGAAGGSGTGTGGSGNGGSGGGGSGSGGTVSSGGGGSGGGGTVSSGGGGGARSGGVRGGSTGAGTGILDLTNMPASVDFWVRFRTYPEATSKDGLCLIMDAGAEEERNRITLLYDRSRSEFAARIYDSSLPDPSIPEGKQYLEVRAKRPLDLQTWYHLRLAWDGTYSGGLQLFIDGLPVGKATFSTELAMDIASQGAQAVPVKDRSALPARGGDTTAVRVGNEIIEVEGGERIRRKTESFYRKWRVAALAQLQQKRRRQLKDGIEPATTPQPVTSDDGTDSGTSALERLLMRGPWNQRASANGHHPRGTPVSVHGYSLEIVRKIRDKQEVEHQASWKHLADCEKRVWTPGGLTLADELLTWANFPPEVVAIVHYAPVLEEIGAGGEAGAGGSSGSGASGSAANGAATGGSVQRFIAPVFLIDGSKAGSGQAPGGAGKPPSPPKFQGNDYYYTAELQWGGKTYQASDFFQREVVLLAWLQEKWHMRGGGIRVDLTQADLHCRKAPLPPDHPAIKAAQGGGQAGGNVGGKAGGKTGGGPASKFWPPMRVPPRTGLEVVEWYPITKQKQGVAGLAGRPTQPRPDLLRTFAFEFGGFSHASPVHLRPISVMASGPVDERYPRSGILEIRGRPTPWSNPVRPDLSTAPLFGNNPEDTVEWIRYVWTHQNRFFIGRYHWITGSYSGNDFYGDPFNGDGYNNHRGYPESQDELKNQMFHKTGEPIRLVMELADGGAGYGDYVSIATNDPSVAEPVVRRIYNVSERNDGRFFVSLVDVDEGGRETATVQPYRNSYTPDMNPRLVKFPSGALPQVGTGRMVLFGESGAGAGRSSAPVAPLGQHSVEEEETAGAILDEVRRSRNLSVRVSPGRGQRVKHILVPLESGKVRYEPMGNGMAGISGLINEGQSVSRDSPIEILVVSAGRDPDLFAPGVERGLLRIGEELFFFENPNADEGKGGGVASGGKAGQGAQGHGQIDKAWVRAQPAKTGQAAPAPAAGSLYDPDQGGERKFDERIFVWPSPSIANVKGNFEREGFARIDDNSPQLAGFYEVFYYRQFGGGRFEDCLRGQFQTAIVAHNGGVHNVTSVTVKLRLVGRGLLGTVREPHGMGDPVSLVPYLDFTEITGPLTSTGIAVKETKGFSPNGYLLLDSGQPQAPFEILAYQGVTGEALFRRPQDEEGKGILRACFGTVERPINSGMFAYGMPFRHFDRYQPEVESESLACLQKSFRVNGARWRSLQWRVRRPRGGQERLCDIVVAARVDGTPDWAEKPTNQKGGLFFFEEKDPGKDHAPEFPLGVAGDELEVRIYFRYRKGSFMRLSQDHYRDDWKETPVLEWLSVEYEKAGRILRHEEPPY
jgi:hypothetical protein